MSRRKRRSFTPEFKAEAVALVKRSGKSVGQIAKELDLTETALREWVRKAEGTPGRSRGDGDEQLGEDEREELRRLRKENQQLKMEREFLKKAAAFFAKESK